MQDVDYEKQATDFIDKFGINFKAHPTDRNSCPKWDDDGKHLHGDEYRITLSRKGMSSKRIWFSFWNSLNDAQHGKPPTAYSVLACIASDINCPDTFEDFCSEYGYEEDSRSACATFNQLYKFSEKLKGFFSDEEIEALQEIR